MGKIRVLVVDDGSSNGLVDFNSALLRDGVEIVGSLRINPQAESFDLLACWERATTSPEESPLVHERSPASGAVVSPVNEGGHNLARSSASQTPDAPVYLTRAELDVLRLLAKGQRNKDIARELYVSVNTVKSHVASIFRKLRVKNRSQAVRYVYSRGVR